MTVLRTLFWAAVGLGGYGILRFRLGWRPSRLVWPREPEPPDGATERNVYFACILTLAGLNALYLAANAADGAYLWLSATLPEGVTYAQYAHQGSYRLIAAVVLAAITVVAFFPAGSMQMNAAKTRGLIHLFLLQNLAVLAGAGRRLHLYVAEYGLTRFRVAVVFWLGLVAVGFVLIHLRVRGRRPVRFLLETNAASVAILLSLVSVLDIDGFIARWNVERYREGVQTRIDVPYLGLLGPGALPELARLETVAAERNDPACARQAHVVLERRLAEEREALSSWRSWTWRRRSAVRGVTDPPRRQ